MVVERRLALAAYRVIYEQIVRPAIFWQFNAQEAHEAALGLLRTLDDNDWAQEILREIQDYAFLADEIEVGGVTLPYPLILAAGFVKGNGFSSEAEAFRALDDQNIIPGWRTMPNLVGLVEFGSYTRWPRLGNAGRVMWREAATRSTQNRVGLKNPGAGAAAAFLAQREIPAQFGINVAVSPGIEDRDQERADIVEAIEAFVSRNVFPTWFTLNLSCPNTEDDPQGHQTADKAIDLGRAAMDAIDGLAPLWVKVGPGLSREQYAQLMRAFAEVGVQAVIATNTLAQPTPNHPHVLGGVAGGKLHQWAVQAAGWLALEKASRGYPVDVIGCGGVLTASTYFDFVRVGVPVVQYWSALIYRGPLAAALFMQPDKRRLI